MRIKVNRDNCTGCRLCMQICAIENYEEINPKKAALRIEAKFPDPGKYRPYVCTQCSKCAEVCPEDAIHQDEIGAYIVDKDKCTNCGDCIPVCPVGVVFQHPALDHVIICTFCMKCTELCNTGAIVKWEKTSSREVKEAQNG
ncbi:4Fe-4S dicluster domain-containing protein [Acidobacteriota bacterium]